MLGALCLSLTAAPCAQAQTQAQSQPVTWHPEVMNGIQYVPLSEVRSFYKLTKEHTDGRHKVYEVPGKIHLRVRSGSQEIFMNGMKFVLSYPIVSHHTKGLMVSNIDLHKMLDPVLRPTYIPNRRNFNTVILDPGHGGHDSGARNRLNREADVNLIVAQKMRDLLKKQGYKVILTRETDTFISLQGRVDIANKYDNAIFISIHFNSGRPAAKGVETFTLAPAGTSSTMSRNVRHDALRGNAQDSMNIALATTAQRFMLKGPLGAKEHYPMEDRGIKRARYSVLCTIKHPAVLVEGGFMSNSQEALLISTDRYRNYLATALTHAVMQYRKVLVGQQRRATRTPATRRTGR